MEFVKQCVMSLGTGIVVGGMFAWLKLAPPSPSVVGLFSVVGLTLGFVLINKLL